MDDPFPIKAPAWLVSAVEPYAVQTGLHTLPQHAHEVLLSVLFYTFIGAVASPWLSRRLFPRTYPQLDHRTRTSWDVHTVSLVQSLVINAAALSVIFADDNWAVMGADGRLRLFGYSGELGLVQSLAAGYFIWDVVVSLRHVRKFGWGFVAHALSALFVFSCGFRPVLNYYSVVFILYELSSPFLNIHWYFDKLDMTGSTAQLMNGVLLLVTFFCCRIVWGSYMSVAVFKDMWAWVMNTKEPHFLHFLSSEKRHIQEPLLPHQSAMMRFTANETLPVWLMGSYLISNIVLHTLNFYWFAKMITALRKRFSPPLGTRNASQTQKRTKDSAKATKKALLQADEHKAKGVAGAGFGGQTSALDTDATRYRTRRKV